MRATKCFLGLAIAAFGLGLLLSCLLPNFALICLVALILVATGVVLLGK